MAGLGRTGFAILALLGAMALAAWGYVASVERSTRASLALRIAERQGKSIDEFDAWMDRRVQQARFWADRAETAALVRALLAISPPSPEALETHPLQEAFRRQFALAFSQEGLLGYFLVSPAGITLAAIDGGLGKPNMLWQEPEFVEHLRSYRAALSPMMAADGALQNIGVALDGRTVTLYVGVPVYLGQPEPAAYFAIRLPPTGLLASQSRARFGTGGVSYLADRLGRLHADRIWLNLDLALYGLESEPLRGRPHLFARDPGVNLYQRPGASGVRRLKPLTRSVRGLQEGDGATLTPYRDHRGILVVGSWAWDAKLNLGVITEMPVSEAFAPVERARLHVLVAGTTLALVAVAILLWRLQRSRRQLQGALVSAEAASRAKGVFVANMSHEIRTPLNAVLGIAHLMGNTPLSATQREYLHMISTSGEALLGILNDILDYSKVEAGKMELAEAEFSLHETIDTLSSIMCVNAAPKDLELVIGIEPDVPAQLRGDAHRLLQILVNLTGNAIKFTHEGEVVLRVSLAAGAGTGIATGTVRLRFEVSDTGIGIAPERQTRLFEAFTQADAGISRHFGGSGLGLAICKRLADLMHGEIGLQSAEGEGSRFWVVLPFQVRESAQAPAPLARGVRDVMVVDDNAIAREFVAKSVERLGWHAHESASGPDAIERIADARAAQGYDVLLIDWKMPGMDGLETSRAVRAIEGIAQPPIVIMVTAFGREQVLGSADAGMVDAVISKPTTPSKILDAVMEADAKRRGGYASPRSVYAPARVVKQLQGLRMLVVEDNYINQQVARGILEAEGASVTTADHGQAAIELLERRPRAFDLVLMDVQMPVLDGLEAARRIRAQLRLTLPIFAMSAGVTPEERRDCFGAGMNAFIAKPLDPQAVVQAIRQVQPLAGAAKVPGAAAGDGALPGIEVPGIEMASLASALNGDRAAMLRLFGRLAEECGRVGAGLEEALAAGRRDQAAWLLHGFKGALANMRAQGLLARTEAVETALRERGLAGLQEGLPALREEALALHSALIEALESEAAAGRDTA